MEQSPESSKPFDEPIDSAEVLGYFEALTDQVAALQTQMDGLLSSLREYGDLIAPTLESLSKSPIARMLGVK